MTIPVIHRSPKRMLIAAAIAIFVTYFLLHPVVSSRSAPVPQPHQQGEAKFGDWANRPENWPSKSKLVDLPEGTPHKLPRIQHDFAADAPDPQLKKLNAARRDAVKAAFKKSWDSYRKYAWGFDELRPETLKGDDTFAGWGATLVDSLDTLWIMGFKDEFEESVKAVQKIDWGAASGTGCSLFETTIRYLGGLLSAYDLSGSQPLLNKALELAHMLYAAFDNPARMPVNNFRFDLAWSGNLMPSSREISAAVGTMSMEFTRLAQLTNETKFYDAIDRIKVQMEKTQAKSYLPGMWPMWLDVSEGIHPMDNSFTLGAQADSLYEYLPKMYALLGGLDEVYAKMAKYMLDTARKHILFRPMVPDKVDILFSGEVIANGNVLDLKTEMQHLSCFVGGMYALSGKLLAFEDGVATGARLARGCAWAYSAFPTGIMAEVATVAECGSGAGKKDKNIQTPGTALEPPCEWNQTLWENLAGMNAKTLPGGFTSVWDRRYLLRPEAIESVFVLYRITGEREWLDSAWAMFKSIRAATETEHAFSGIGDVTLKTRNNKIDSMESFWLSETLKYFFLIFSEPDVISLDDFVLNTEAHPFRIPKPR
ncbi:hypothetical protein RB597_002050 [Gaeumannomyces tritici]